MPRKKRGGKSGISTNARKVDNKCTVANEERKNVTPQNDSKNPLTEEKTETPQHHNKQPTVVEIEERSEISHHQGKRSSNQKQRKETSQNHNQVSVVESTEHRKLPVGSEQTDQKQQKDKPGRIRKTRKGGKAGGKTKTKKVSKLSEQLHEKEYESATVGRPDTAVNEAQNNTKSENHSNELPKEEKTETSQTLRAQPRKTEASETHREGNPGDSRRPNGFSRGNQPLPTQTGQKQEDKENSERKRRSRWSSAGEETAEAEGAKKRKSRWSTDEPKANLIPQANLSAFLNEAESKLPDLTIRIEDINLKICSEISIISASANSDVWESSEILKLWNERQEIVSVIIRLNPSYEPPKLFEKIYIPFKQYPGYNFIGLILGPRGNTQKRLEMESGAKILIRGRECGNLQEKRPKKPEPGDDDELHVRIEAENPSSLTKASRMIKNLLIPVEDKKNTHKKAQLEELASLKGTSNKNILCTRCGKSGHIGSFCPLQPEVSSAISKFDTSEKKPLTCLIDLGTDTPEGFSVTESDNPEELYRKFLLDGNSGGGAAVGTEHRDPNSGGGAAGVGAGQGSEPTSRNRNDESDLYVGHLAPSVDELQLFRLFSPFGLIEKITLKKDIATGESKGYGFVKYFDAFSAAEATKHLNGFLLQGKQIVVRVAGRSPPIQPGSTPINSGGHAGHFALPTQSQYGLIGHQQLPIPALVPVSGLLGVPLQAGSLAGSLPALNVQVPGVPNLSQGTGNVAVSLAGLNAEMPGISLLPGNMVAASSYTPNSATASSQQNPLSSFGSSTLSSVAGQQNRVSVLGSTSPLLANPMGSVTPFSLSHTEQNKIIPSEYDKFMSDL